MAGHPLDEGVKVSTQPAYLVPPVIAKALISIQAELEPLIKTAENSAYSSTYVPLDQVMQKALKLLSSKKIAVVQPMVTDDKGHAALETILVHESGKSFSRTTKLAMREVDPQKHGSAVTYTRRYALMTMIGLTAKDDDDDGNGASGALVPVTEDQIAEIKMLLSHLKWPRKSIAAAVFSLKTRDAAALAILNYQKMISEKVRDEESKANATEIEVATDEGTVESDASPQEALQARINKLGLRDKAAENKFVFSITGRPFLSKVTTSEQLQELERAITLLETGKHTLPADFYAPTTEPRTVQEPVA